jgi:UDP-glucuronate 4-epimerase
MTHSVASPDDRTTGRPDDRTILVTGAAGFIGSHVAERLLARGQCVVGLDNLNDYYDPRLKEARLARLTGRPGFSFVRGGIEDRALVARVFAEHRPRRVVHLAAQAGVRYSLTNPHAYADANLVGFVNILEACRQAQVEHLAYASSSSVYGLNQAMPFSVHHNVDHPVSLYAATKKANELMAHTYSHLFGLPTTGLRFFTVYGPWGRPDMALFQFTAAILAGKPIELYNHGKMRRDFTYIDDIADGVVKVVDRVPQGDPAWSGAHPDPGSSPAPYRIYNIGNGDPVELERFVAAIEAATGRTAQRVLKPMQPGDVPATAADVSDLARDFAWRPSTPVELGVRRFVDWYREYHHV